MLHQAPHKMRDMTNLMRHDPGAATGDRRKEISVRHKSYHFPQPVAPWKMGDDLIALGQMIAQNGK